MTLRWWVLTTVIVGCGHAPVETRSSPSPSPSTSPSTSMSTSEPVTADAGAPEATSIAETVAARHILVRVGQFPGGKSHTSKQAHAIVDQVKKRLDAGEDFSDLARTYSEDPSTAKSGGDLGSFGRGKMVPEFENAVFALAPYEVTIVETVFGVHLVQRTR